MKKWIPISIVSVLVLGIGAGTGYYFYNKHVEEVAAEQQAKKLHAYGQNLNVAVLDMLDGTMKATVMCATYSSVWDQAIQNNFVTIGDKTAFTFDEAIQYQEQSFQSDGSQSSIDSNKSSVDKLMQECNNPPQEFKSAYDTAIQMYDSYTQLMSEAESPTGSLVNFNSTTDQIESDINKKASEFKIELPQS